jgi:stage V sporulation protein SpoVS
MSARAKVLGPFVAEPTVSASTGERELAWYFGAAEGEMGRTSNLVVTLEVARTGVVGILETEPEDALERRVAAAHAARVVEQRLANVEAGYVGVLAAAYEAVAWPRGFLERYGVIAGVVVRVAAAYRGERVLPGHGRRTGVRVLERARTDEGRAELERAHEEARGLYRAAIAAYERVRGDGVSVVPEGDR